MYQTLEEILKEANDRHYAMDFDTTHNHCVWWIFPTINEPIHGGKNTIEDCKEDLYHTFVRLAMMGNYPWYDK